jgi:CBS domain-containing protein/alkylated DNA nucleotide flippase Atl1
MYTGRYVPFSVSQLIEGKQPPVTALPSEPLPAALERMIEHDFSQLPVVDQGGSIHGLVTSDSVVRVLSHFGTTAANLRVWDAITRARTFGLDDDIFDLLEDLRTSYAVLITDGEQHLAAVVTSYDTTEYFQRRAEDMMLVEDVETMLKDKISAAFRGDDGAIDESSLAAAIAHGSRKTPGNLSGQLHAVLTGYLEHRFGFLVPMDEDLLADQIAAAFPPDTPTPFERLTLSQYIDLFLLRDRWQFHKEEFPIDPKLIRTLLIGVLDTRNKLAHFRAELSSAEREQLRFCKDWLSRHRNRSTAAAVIARVDVPEIDGGPPSTAEPVAMPLSDDRLSDEAPGPTDSRFSLLGVYLQNQSADLSGVKLGFQQIESIIQNLLPPSARRHRSWWANDPTTHAQASDWVSNGWKVSDVDFEHEEVVFTPLLDRRRAYAAFFDALALKLNDSPLLSVSSSRGQPWLVVGRLPRGAAVGQLTVSFAMRGRFRVEFYIDTGVAQTNKTIFDELYAERAGIEESFGERLTWERLDERRASRIAAYRTLAITDPPEKLDELRDWAAASIGQLELALREPVGRATRDVSVGFDWRKVDAAVAHIPPGNWTSYGDLAELGGTSAMAVGQHLAHDERVTNAYRVLSSNRRPSADFHWWPTDEHRPDIFLLLKQEGVPFDASGAAQDTKRLSAADLELLLEAIQD